MDLKEKIKILIIDDEKDNLDTIEDSLRNSIYILDKEINPNTALSKIQSEYYDIIITDLMMPDVSGIEIAEAVHATNRDTLVIVVTGHASVDSAVKSIKYGVYDYIEKPFTDIESTVKRASDFLLLQRKNNALKKRMEETLAKISLLHEISSILYKVNDFDESSEMILDAINEVFKIKYAGILLKDSNKQQYKIFKGRHLNDEVNAKFTFSENDLINGEKISTKDLICINNVEGKIEISGKSFPVDKSIQMLGLVPINFHINTLGYLVVFTDNEVSNENSDNLLEIMEIFCNQIAPILFTAVNQKKNNTASFSYIYNIIDNQLSEAKELLTPISFSLIRLKFIKTPNEISMVEDYLSTAVNLINKEIKTIGEIFWQNKDTGLVVFPAADLFMLEQFCVGLKNKIETMQLTGNKEKIISLKYACINYPQSGNSPVALANMLWKHLFEELEKQEQMLDTN